MYNSGDDIGAIVADIGSFASRVGFAGDDQPKAYLPTVKSLSFILRLVDPALLLI
jgi:actin-related protein